MDEGPRRYASDIDTDGPKVKVGRREPQSSAFPTFDRSTVEEPKVGRKAEESALSFHHSVTTFVPAQPPRRLRCSKVERAGNESSFALCRLKLEEPMFRKISYLGFNLQRKEDERWKEFRNKGYFVSGIFPIVPPVPFVSSSKDLPSE